MPGMHEGLSVITIFSSGYCVIVKDALAFTSKEAKTRLKMLTELDASLVVALAARYMVSLGYIQYLHFYYSRPQRQASIR